MIIKKMVGVEITDTEIRAVEMFGSIKSHKVLSVGSIALGEKIIEDGMILDMDKLSEAMIQLWRTYKIKSKDVFFGVDNKYVIVRYAEIPGIIDKNFKDKVSSQIQNFLPIDKNTVEIDFVPIDEIIGDSGERKVKTLVVAAGKKMINDYCQLFQNCGLRLEDIEVNNVVLSRNIPLNADKDKGILFMNFKKDIMNIYITKNDKPLLARNIAINTEGAVAEKDFISMYLSSIGDDLISSLEYYNSATEEYIDKIYITGYGVWNEEMVTFIRETSKINVEIINPFKHPNSKNPGLSVERPHEYSIAYALALRGLEGE